MIVNVIVLSALVLAGIYVAIWATRKEFRDRVEAPKQEFQHQVSSFDARFVDGNTSLGREGENK